MKASNIPSTVPFYGMAISTFCIDILCFFTNLPMPHLLTGLLFLQLMPPANACRRASLITLICLESFLFFGRPLRPLILAGPSALLAPTIYRSIDGGAGVAVIVLTGVLSIGLIPYAWARRIALFPLHYTGISIAGILIVSLIMHLILRKMWGTR